MSDTAIQSEGQSAGIHWIRSQPVPVRTVNAFGVDVIAASSLIAVQMADAMDKFVVDAIIAEAVKAGCTEGFVIDRQFVLEAITEKVKRERVEGANELPEVRL